MRVGLALMGAAFVTAGVVPPLALFLVTMGLVAIGSGASVVTLAGSIAVIVTLFTGGANDWFRNKHAVSGPPTHQPW